MNEFEQLEKYKSLLDDDVITEAEFQKIKQKILGLKTDEEMETEFQQEKVEEVVEKTESEVADEIESLQETQSEEITWTEPEAPINQQSVEPVLNVSPIETREDYQKVYSTEKAKERARLEVLEEFRQKERQEQQEKITKAAKATTSVVKNVILWVITLFWLLTLLGCILAFPNPLYIVVGIISLLFAAMACPVITERTRNIEKLSTYYTYKKLIVIALVIVFVVIVMILA